MQIIILKIAVTRSDYKSENLNFCVDWSIFNEKERGYACICVCVCVRVLEWRDTPLC